MFIKVGQRVANRWVCPYHILTTFIFMLIREAKFMGNNNKNEKLCRHCGKILPLDSFHKNNQSKDGHTSRCKECSKEYYRRDENKRRMKEYQAEYYRKNKEKLKEYEKSRPKRDRRIAFNNSRTFGHGYITEEQWDECIEFFDNVCAYSGEEFDASIKKDRLTVEHIVSVECGGCGFPWNIIPVKQSYNSEKHTQNMYEWYIKKECFSVIRLLKIEAWKKYAYNKWGYLLQEDIS